MQSESDNIVAAFTIDQAARLTGVTSVSLVHGIAMSFLFPASFMVNGGRTYGSTHFEICFRSEL